MIELVGELAGNLGIAIVGIAFSSWYFPKKADQRALEREAYQIRAAIVSAASETVMEFFVELEYDHPLSWRRRVDSMTGTHESQTLAAARKKFDTQRCVIGTKLEVYFRENMRPSQHGYSENLKLARLWTRFAERVIKFSEAEDEPGLDNLRNEWKLVPSVQLRLDQTDQLDAPEDVNGREIFWRIEQALLLEKAELLNFVRREPVSLAG